MTKTKLQFEDHTVTFEDTPEARERVWKACLKWFTRLEHWDGESLQQCDDAQTEAINFVSNLADKAFKFKVKYNDE